MSRLVFSFLLLSWQILASILGAAETPARLDQYGDPLPEHALARLGTMRFVRQYGAGRLIFSPDSKYLASGTFSNTMLLDLQTGRPIRQLKGIGPPGIGLRTLAFSPDGKLIATACDSTQFFGKAILSLWDVATEKILFQLIDSEKDYTWDLAFSPDGKTLASFHDSGRIRLWDVKTGKVMRTLLCPEEEDNRSSCLSRLAFNPDGKTLTFVGSEGKVCNWDLATGKETRGEIKIQEDGFPRAFSPDRSLVVIIAQDCVRLIRLSNLTEMRRFKVGALTALTFLPDGKTLILHDGDDESLGFWEVASGKLMRKIPTKNMWVHDVTVSPDGKTIAGACGSNGEVIFLWDAKTGEAKTKQKRHLGPVNKVAFLEDGQTVVAEAHFSHIVWPQGTGKEEYRVKLLSGADSSCYLNHATLAARIGKELILLNLPSGKEFKRFPIPDQMGKFTLSADNRWIAFHDPKSIEVWDLSTFKMLRRLRIDPTDVHLSPDGRVLVVRDNAHIYRCIDLDTQKEFWNLAAPYTRDCPVVFSPNGRMVAVPNKEQGFRLLEVTTGQDRLHLKGQTKEVSAFAFSHDGKTLASGDETTVRLWDLQNGKEMQILRGHVGTVRSVDFSPDGRKLVSGSDDLTALVWKIPPECQYQKPQVIHLGREEKDKLWGKLAAVDAAAAYAALQRLAAADADAVALCRERLFESPPTPPRQIERWIGQLDDEEFAIRDKATNNLERVEGDAKNALESALKRECSIEKKQRIEALLETLNAKQSFIRVIRAVELLEQIGTAEAVDVLRQLEKKTGDAAVRDDVRRSLDRLQAKQKSR